MVIGLTKFIEEFKELKECFVVIGGTACELLFSDAGQNFRSTSDIDLVILAERLNHRFIEQFWSFIKEGGYTSERANGTRTLYRFSKPTNSSFPKQIELFARTNDVVFETGNTKIIPIFHQDYQILSAILLDDAYYELIKSGILIIDDLPILSALHILPLKVKAYLNNKQRKSEGECIPTENITKHCRDVFRLTSLLSKNDNCKIPHSIKSDMKRFVSVIYEHIEDLGNFWSKDEINEKVNQLISIYQLDIESTTL